LAAARNGDELALAVLSKVARTLGMVMAVYVATLNPKKIIIGGGLGMAAFDFFVPEATIELKKRVFVSGIDDLQILPSRVISPAVGAASLVWYNLNPI
jgi:predicted NBD/HSP70 family sugar kinase